jgi:hypothetical protein
MPTLSEGDPMLPTLIISACTVPFLGADNYDTREQAQHIAAAENLLLEWRAQTAPLVPAPLPD